MSIVSDAQRMYRQNAAQGATPIGLVIVLFDSAIEDMRRALMAMQSADLETRGAGMGHALLVLQQLQGSLDFERGGAAARQLEQFYNTVRAKLLEAQIRNSQPLLQRQIQAMSEVRDCWVTAEKQLFPRSVTPAATVTATANNDLERAPSPGGWEA